MGHGAIEPTIFIIIIGRKADEESLTRTQVSDAVVVDPKGMKSWHVWQFHVGCDLVVVQHQGDQGRELGQKPEVTEVTVKDYESKCMVRIITCCNFQSLQLLPLDAPESSIFLQNQTRQAFNQHGYGYDAWNALPL